MLMNRVRAVSVSLISEGKAQIFYGKLYSSEIFAGIGSHYVRGTAPPRQVTSGNFRYRGWGAGFRVQGLGVRVQALFFFFNSLKPRVE